MTATERDVAAEAIGGTVRATPAGMLVIERHGGRLTVSQAEAEALARELRAAVFDNAPEMRRVIGPVDRDEVWSVEQAQAAMAEGWEIQHGLQCPHTECGYIGWADESVAVFVVDVDERWSAASYERDVERRVVGGRIGEVVRTGGADTNYEGLGYRCISCYKPVTLPDGVEEEWI